MSMIHTTVDRIIETALVKQHTYAQKLIPVLEPDSRLVADDILLIIAAQLGDQFPAAAKVLRNEVDLR